MASSSWKTTATECWLAVTISTVVSGVLFPSKTAQEVVARPNSDSNNWSFTGRATMCDGRSSEHCINQNERCDLNPEGQPFRLIHRLGLSAYHWRTVGAPRRPHTPPNKGLISLPPRVSRGEYETLGFIKDDNERLSTLAPS